jgi:hypothetical protein
VAKVFLMVTLLHCAGEQEVQDSECKILSSFSDSAVDMDSMKLDDEDIKVLTDLQSHFQLILRD